MSMPEGLEHTTCNICGSDDYALYHEQQDLRYRDTPRGTFQLVQCHKCGLLYLNPRPSEAVIGDYYPPVLSTPTAWKSAGSRTQIPILLISPDTCTTSVSQA
jgi:hypothetical protein